MQVRIFQIKEKKHLRTCIETVEDNEVMKMRRSPNLESK